MTKEELTQELTEFAKMAFVDSMNPETGFLTRNRINPLTNEQITEFSLQTEEIICQMAQHLEIGNIGNVPSDYECGMLFQYVFEKVCMQKGGFGYLFLLSKVKNNAHFYFYKVKNV